MSIRSNKDYTPAFVCVGSGDGIASKTNGYDDKSTNCNRDDVNVPHREAQSGRYQGLQMAPDPELSTTTPL